MTLFESKVNWIMPRLIKDFGLNPWQAAAIVGNLAHECGGFRIMQEQKPTVPGSLGGYGWAQWTGPRRREFFAWCKKNNLSVDSNEGNYGFLAYELKNTEKKAIPAVKNAKTMHDAVIAFELAFERAGVKHYHSRQIYAGKALSVFKPVIIRPTEAAEVSSAGAVIVAGGIAATQTPTNLMPYIFVATLLVALGAWLTVRWYKNRQKDK